MRHPRSALYAHVVSLLTACCLGKLLAAATHLNQQEPSEQYELVEPQLLLGGLKRPVNLIKGLFASHYTETHYLEDGRGVTKYINV
ncbi:hypothetical protein DNTS_013119, partial [Danionella cerebrum]